MVTCLVLAFGILNLVTFRPDPARLFDNPDQMKLRGIDGKTIRSELLWQNLELRLRGLAVEARIEGHFTQSGKTMTRLLAVKRPKSLVQSSPLSLDYMPGAEPQCIGQAQQLECTIKVDLRLKTPLGTVNNRASFATRTSTLLEGNSVVFSHRLVGRGRIPDQVIARLNKELAKSDKVQKLPDFFTKHRVSVIDYAFAGRTVDDTLRVRFTLNAGLGRFLQILFLR